MTFRQRVLLVLFLTVFIAGRWGHAQIQQQEALQFFAASNDSMVHANGAQDEEESMSEDHDQCERIHVNEASAEELTELPGIGPVLAERIIETRTEEAFAEPECLLRVPGIGAVRLEQIAPLICLIDHGEHQPE